MNISSNKLRLKGFRYPRDIIAYAVWAYHRFALSTADVARSWMKYLPVASTYTAERAAYKALLSNAHEWFPEGKDAGFDLTLCADNAYNDWIGAQIRADLYGWVCPGNPDLAAKLVTADRRELRALHQWFHAHRATVARLVRERVLNLLDVADGGHAHLVAEPVWRLLIDGTDQLGGRFFGWHMELMSVQTVSASSETFLKYGPILSAGGFFKKAYASWSANSGALSAPLIER